jgi:thiamine-monophosphate kinase
MNEFDFIRRLREQTQTRKHSARVIAGIGDDASLISQTANRQLVVTTDLLVEGIDFDPEAAPPRWLGHKALAVSLSDIAAMGARPCWSFVSIGMPSDVWRADFKDGFFAGYLALSDQYGVTLAGGDVSETKAGIVIDSIVLGEVEPGAAVLRSGANPGDQIYVTGSLGGAAAGLKLIEMGARLGDDGLISLPRPGTRSDVKSVPGADRGPRAGSPPGVVNATGSTEARDLDTRELEAIETVLLRQVRPSPRVGWGIVLGEERLATAMIDLSDGLSSDIDHLCRESNAGALIQAAQIPIDPEVTRLCGRRALDPLALALHGGEDFELLFTVSPSDAERLPKRVDGVAVSCIGEITAEPGSIKIAERNRVWDLRPEGFEHFSNKSNAK